MPGEECGDQMCTGKEGECVTGAPQKHSECQDVGADGGGSGPAMTPSLL